MFGSHAPGAGDAGACLCPLIERPARARSGDKGLLPIQWACLCTRIARVVPGTGVRQSKLTTLGRKWPQSITTFFDVLRCLGPEWVMTAAFDRGTSIDICRPKDSRCFGCSRGPCSGGFLVIASWLNWCAIYYTHTWYGLPMAALLSVVSSG